MAKYVLFEEVTTGNEKMKISYKRKYAGQPSEVQRRVTRTVTGLWKLHNGYSGYCCRTQLIPERCVGTDSMN